jgi:hypothetical protein
VKKKKLLQYCGSSGAAHHPPKSPRNTPQVHCNLAGDGIGGFVTQALDAIRGASLSFTDIVVFYFMNYAQNEL